MKILKILIYLLLTWFVLHVILICADGFIDNGNKADDAVILGNKVNTDGSLSERLKARVDHGLKLYQNGRVKTLIVSGGLGKEGFYEGDKMKEYLVKNGVPESQILVDNFGDNTEATVRNTLKMKDSTAFNSLIVVSQYFHATRTKMLYRKHGFKNINSSSPTYFEIRDFYSILREFVGYYVQG
jgi:vancomycin permeability regulator SanA